jgi:hypothetical protein
MASEGKRRQAKASKGKRLQAIAREAKKASEGNERQEAS